LLDWKKLRHQTYPATIDLLAQAKSKNLLKLKGKFSPSNYMSNPPETLYSPTASKNINYSSILALELHC
jgi:hypothetical protein